ncbi:transcription factor bHLH111-like [Olea europaea var. sylvestris]|uniref:transcription factor bHLH111-like n=1 Tax=Olea europaea var. sylvestris TaxID=158386 RepID=UPI000C1D05BA|nr:transcription factor bHLH111-like [Olea europaea var. sylvestris]
MKNVIFPQVSSHLYSFGYNEAVSNIIPAQIDSNFLRIPNGNSYDSSFCMDLDAQNQHSLFGEIVSMYSQSSVDYTSGPPLTMPIERLDCPPFVEKSHSTSMPIFDNNNIFQPPVSLGNALPVKQKENELLPTQNTRKRSAEVTDKKLKKAMFFQEDMEGEKITRRRVPTRRSQKLTDKITALQKLVSPYGKTDTASVLLEAYISINVLQDQVQNLLHIQGAEKGVDLQRRGLCLIPVSFTRKLTEDCSLY